jgi:hypothetical protein
MSERRPRQELMPLDDETRDLMALIPELPNINTMTRTVFGARHETKLAEAHEELFNALTRAQESFFRLRTTDARMRAAFARDVLEHQNEVLRLQYVREHMAAAHDIALARARAELMDIARQAQLPAPPPPPREKDDDDTDTTRLVKGMKRLHNRVEKLMPEIKANKEKYDRLAAEGYLSADEADALKRQLDDMVRQVIAKP